MKNIQGINIPNHVLGDVALKNILAHVTTFGDLLDGVGDALCFFDNQDRCLYWNRSFLNIFPEHAEAIYEGEPYRENLRRFYQGRLSEDERANIDLYIEAGIARHHSDDLTYVFEHGGRTIQVSCLPIGNQGRLRVWRADDNKSRINAPSAFIDFVDNEPPIVIKNLLDEVPDGLMICNANGCIIWINYPFIDMYKLPERNMALGNTLEFVLRTSWAKFTSHEDAEILNSGLRSLQDNLRFSGAPFELQLPNQRFVRVTSRPTTDETLIYTHVDITELKRQQRQLAQAELSARRDSERAYFLATHDTLTLLPNRMHANEKLISCFELFKRSGVSYVLMMIDIDHFKSVNDAHGHAVGDQVLCAVANTLKQSIRATDFAARVGGEEFLVLLPATTMDAARIVAQKLLTAIQTMESPIGKPVTISIGVAEVSREDKNQDEGLIKADNMLYEAKRAGRNRAIFAAV